MFSPNFASARTTIWQDTLQAGASCNRANGRFICLAFLASVFHRPHDMPGSERGPSARLAIADNSLRIVTAGKEHLTALASLFDAYRQFYHREPDPALARKFLRANLDQERSVILLALDCADAAVGFGQLYPSWCSVSASPIWILYDLFVDPSARQRGVGRALLGAAEKMARTSGASRIDLETATGNDTAQALYEALGYQRETEYYKYSLALN